MDLRRLEVFVKLMETGSFSRTGKELDLTQPTISGHLKTLEQQIGLQLFDRRQRQVKPTAAALVLLDYARRILDLTDEAGFALERFRGRIGGRLALGGSTIPGAYILPAVMGRFHQLYPETYLHLVQGDSQDVVDLAAAGEIECGMVGAELARDDLAFEPLIEDQMVLVAPAGHPLARTGRPVKIKDLAAYPFILREPGSGTRTALEAALAAQGLSAGDLRVVAEMGGTEAVRQAVRAGLGLSILSRVAVEDAAASGQVAILDLKGVDLSRRFYMVYHRKRTHSPVCDAFLEFLRTEGRRVGWGKA